MTFTVGMAPQLSAEDVARMLGERGELLAMLERVTDGLSKDAYGCTDGTCLKCEAEALVARIKDGT